jgi:dTDP-D-glucose 4,6-dehydratase
LLVSTAKIQQRLDWHPPFTVSAGLCSTVAWYQSAKR